MNVILLRKLRIRLMLLPVLLLFAVVATGQSASTYIFSSSVGTYTQINNATATELTGEYADTYISPAQNIGFNFVYEGVTYTQFAMSSNGFITFNVASPSSLTTNNFSTANSGTRPVIAPLWDDLDGRATGSVSYAGYEVTGTSPNRVLTVEWRNWEWNYGSSNPVMSFEVKLYETTNVIEFVYRQESGSVNSGSASIGIGSASGSGSGSYLNVTDVITPAVSSTSSVTNISTKPANNQVFAFTPPPACSGQPAVAQATATVTNACSNTAFTLGVSGLPTETGYTYEFESSPAGANTWTSLGAAQTSPTFNIASQTTATDYRVVVTCSNSGLSTAATLVSVGQNPFSACYCTPVSNCTNEGIVNVTFDALNNSSVYCGTSGYADYTSLGALATVTQAQVIPITVSARVNDGGGNNAGVWIDYDHSGTFDATEYTSLGSTGPISTTPDTFAFTANISIPATALTGVTRMRVREANASGITATSACNTGTVYGEYEDYLITINAGTACSGQPSAGTISGPTTVCPSTSFTIATTGFTSGTLGLTYEWQVYDAATSSWVAASGTNNGTSYAVTGITAATDYRFVVGCSAGSGDTSAPFTVGIAPFNQCYCTPATTSSSYYINNFTTTNGISNIYNTGSGYSTAGYGDFTSTQTVAVLEGGSFDFSSAYTGGTFGTKIWIDFNQNGLFTDAGEQVFVSTGYHSSESGTITIPSGALTGNTRMRIGVNYNNNTGPANPCANFSNGEYEDYTVNIIPLVACSGTPTPGTAYGPAAVCSGSSFTLADTAYSFGTGLTYQWQESPAGAGVWSDILGATAATYTVSAGITSATDYRFVVTCSNGGSSDNSNVVYVAMDPFYNCYCIPLSNCTNEGIDSVSFDALNNTSAYCATSGYTDYGSMGSLATVTQAQAVSMAVKAHVNSNPASVGVWIDYDHSGTFDASEYTSLGSSNGISPLPSEYIFSGNIVIPATAQTGITRMRVRSANQGGITATSACNTGTVYGEFEDYLITINAGASCSGSVTAGSINGPTSVCSGRDFTLNATGYTSGTIGLTYEWQVYDAGTGLWSPASGTNNGTSYTAIGGITTPVDYRFVVTCTNGGSIDATGNYSIALNSPTQCYCIPAGTNSSHYIEDFSTTGGVQNISNLSSGFSSGGYGDFTAADTVSVAANTTFTINSAFAGSNYGVKIWIDFDGDGDFTQTGDEIYASSAYFYSISQPITIPATATPITTRMRIGISYTPNSGPSGPCMTNLNGEYEDYTITILPAPACLPPSGLAAANATTTSIDLSWTENGTATQWSIEYGPTGFAQGTGTFVSAPTNPFTLPGLNAGTAYDVYVKSMCSATDSSSANGPVNVSTAQIPVSSYPYTTNWDNGGTGSWTLSNGSETNKWFVGTPGDNPAYATGPTPGGLYVSNDGGVTSGYNNGVSSVVHAYRDLDLSSFSAAVPLTFNSYIVGEGATTKYDYLSVWIVPVTYEPVPGTNLNTVGSATQIGSSINLESGWTQHLLNIPASATGGTARLVLQWRNDGSSGSAPVKVDNLTIGGFPLVIKLRDINATNLGAKNRVDWSTESELKSDKFELERSADGRNFTYLAKIKAKGEASNYSYVDISPVTGVNYYRLKMIDAAGTVATSKVVTATVKQGTFTVEAYPNPVSEKLTVKVYGGSDQNATVAITDVTGKVMKVVNVVNGKAEVNMNGLASGVYLVKYTDNNHSQTIKVNKQ